MNRFAYAGFALLLAIASSTMAADKYYDDSEHEYVEGDFEEFSEVEYYKKLEEAQKDGSDDATPILEYVHPPLDLAGPVIEYETPVPEAVEEVYEDDYDVVLPPEDDDEMEIVVADEDGPLDSDDEYEADEIIVEEEPDEEIIVEDDDEMHETVVSPPSEGVVYYETGEDYPGESSVHTFSVASQYFNSRSKKAKLKYGSQRLEMAKGKSDGAGFSLVYNRKVNDYLDLGFMYQYTFMNVDSGYPVARGSGLGNKESSRWNSHSLGVMPKFDLGAYGRLQFGVLQSFDRAKGYEQREGPAGTFTRMNLKKYGHDVTSLTAWYEKDFQIGCNWKFTPYAGWNSRYVDVKDKNDFARNTTYNDYYWVHLASGGLKLAYQQGAFGFNLRGGVSHRFSKNDVHGYGARAVAPGVLQYSHNANLDRTVGTAGAGVTYSFTKRAAMNLGYDGYFGKYTRSHTGTLSFTFAF